MEGGFGQKVLRLDFDPPVWDPNLWGFHPPTVDAFRFTLTEKGEKVHMVQNGWTASSSTQWTCVWANSGRQWRPGKPGMMQSMGSQGVRPDWTATMVLRGTHLGLFLSESEDDMEINSFLFTVIRNAWQSPWEGKVFRGKQPPNLGCLLLLSLHLPAPVGRSQTPSRRHLWGSDIRSRYSLWAGAAC